MASRLTAADTAIVLAYLAMLAGIGLHFSRRPSSLESLLVAGRRMSWLPVGLSLMAALNSGIDYLTQPSATIQYGLVLVVGTLSWLAIYPWVSRVVFPFYHRLDFYSVYEYLEARFDVRVRTLGATIFVVWRLGWMATALYVPCLAIHAVTGGAVNLTVMIASLGALVTLYTMLGGIQAVIWNDVAQFFVMFGGLVATVVIVSSSVPGGISEVWRVADLAGKTDFWAPIGAQADAGVLAGLAALFTQPMTVPALLSALVVGRMAQYTSDQVMVQRLRTTRSLQDARQAFIVNAAGDALWMIGLSFVGLALYAYYLLQPASAELPPDRLLPHFMAQAFPAGAVGLVIAAILAASLSSVDSAIHSCSSVVLVDLHNRLLLGQRRAARRAQDVTRDVARDDSPATVPATSPDAGAQVRTLRAITALVGAAGTTLACNVAGIGTLLEIANKLINAFTGPLFGIFLVAMFSRRATSLAALLGGSAGAVVSYVVAYHSAIGFLWPSTFGLAATLGVSAVVTAVTGRQPSTGNGDWTWWAVTRTDHRRPGG